MDQIRGVVWFLGGVTLGPIAACRPVPLPLKNPVCAPASILFYCCCCLPDETSFLNERGGVICQGFGVMVVVLFRLRLRLGLLAFCRDSGRLRRRLRNLGLWDEMPFFPKAITGTTPALPK